MSTAHEVVLTLMQNEKAMRAMQEYVDKHLFTPFVRQQLLDLRIELDAQDAHKEIRLMVQAARITTDAAFDKLLWDNVQRYTKARHP